MANASVDVHWRAPAGTYTAARRAAARADLSLNRLVTEAVEAYLRQQATPAPREAAAS